MAELLRENKRALDKSIREIERERQNLQNQEKKLIAEIKKTAKQGQMVSVQTWAWNLWSSIAICFFLGGRKGLVQACELLAFIRFSKVGFTCLCDLKSLVVCDGLCVSKSELPWCKPIPY